MRLVSLPHPAIAEARRAVARRRSVKLAKKRGQA